MSKPDEKNNAKMSCAFHSAGVTGETRLNNETMELQDHRWVKTDNSNNIQLFTAFKGD